jgi:replicative DNA helicase
MEFLSNSKKVLMVSQEMTPSEVALKLARMVRNQPLDSPQFLRSMSDEELESVKQDIRRIAKHLFTTDSFGTLEVDKIDKAIHQLTAEGLKPELVVIDHLLAICSSLEANTIVDTCKQIKELARNHQVCIVLLSHVRKLQGERGKAPRPKLADAYGGQGLQMYADCVFGVSSDKVKKQTYIETVKLERLGGKYADVVFSFEDYCLCEAESATYYGQDDEIEEEESDPF